MKDLEKNTGMAAEEIRGQQNTSEKAKAIRGEQEKSKTAVSETWAEDTIADLDDFIESQGIYIRQ
ncbi:MAG: hypothetical protein Q4C59_07475 [Lachnospiraceae bacterium]|nr:hypothetical protein [Lachnospiraceae bacterium]